MLKKNIIRFSIIIASALMMGACDKGIGKDVKEIAGELMKSKAQQAAEDGCFQAAANEEASRFKDYRALSTRVPETTDLGGNHYLVKVVYKVITLDSPSGQCRQCVRNGEHDM